MARPRLAARKSFRNVNSSGELGCLSMKLLYSNNYGATPPKVASFGTVYPIYVSVHLRARDCVAVLSSASRPPWVPPQNTNRIHKNPCAFQFSVSIFTFFNQICKTCRRTGSVGKNHFDNFVRRFGVRVNHIVSDFGI